MLSLRMPQVFKSVKVTDDCLALRWPGGFIVSLYDLTRPLTLGAHRGACQGPLPAPPALAALLLYAFRAGELDAILRSYPVPEDRLLHRLHDITLCLRHHLFGDLSVALLRRPWPYAAHRCPHDRQLHTLLTCFQWGRLDLVEDHLWALLRGEAAG